jgi:hypothetical protein
MLAVVAGVLFALGRYNHFLDQEATSFVQLYGDQITQALSWTSGDGLTLPLVEEIEQFIHLFNAIVASQPLAAQSSQSRSTEDSGDCRLVRRHPAGDMDCEAGSGRASHERYGCR